MNYSCADDYSACYVTVHLLCCFPWCSDIVPWMWILSGIKRRSKVPGVMITQYIEELPEGMTTPDFTRKPIALTIQEGKHIKREESKKMKANMIIGDSWELNDPECEINKLEARTEDYHTDLLP